MVARGSSPTNTYQKWTPDFNAYTDRITHLTVWVRVCGLHAERFDPHCMKQIGDLIGSTRKVDLWTTSQTRGKFARVCVEIVLRKPLDANLKVKDEWY